MPRWRDILRETRQELNRDNVSLVAAGVAFYMFFGTIPALAAVISIYGLVMDPQQIQQHFQYLTSVMPEGTQELENQILGIASNQAVAGWGVVLGLLVTIWSGSKATKALITSTNLAYNCPNNRGFVKLTLLSLALTLSGVVFVTLAIALVAILPAVLNSLGLGNTAQFLLTWLRWPLLILGFLIAIAVLYRYGPNRPTQPWRWITPGALLASFLWVAGSLLLSLYVSQFANINKTYGSLGAIALLLLWFYLSAFAVIAGAEVNAVIERLSNGNTSPDKAQQSSQSKHSQTKPA
jgi:membrane protein